MSNKEYRISIGIKNNGSRAFPLLRFDIPCSIFDIRPLMFGIHFLSFVKNENSYAIKLFRVRSLLRSLLAMYVMVPLVAVLLVVSLDLPSGVEIALLILAVSAGAPLLPRKLKFLGREPYIFSLMVLSSLLSILIVPTWLALLGSMFAVPRVLEPNEVALVLAKALFLPLVAGMLLRWLFPQLTERIIDRLLGIVGVVFMVCALLLLALHWTLLLEAGWPFVLTLFTMALLALGIGHALGGPHPDGRTALAVACATRHVGVAVLVAATLPGPRTAVLITAYIVTSAVITLPYLRWQRRRRHEDGEKGHLYP